jgi:NADH-quinone oxidoreductase subunit J
VATAFFAAGAWMLQASEFQFAPGGGERSVSDVHEIGRRLMDYGPSGYVLPFEIISVLLLAAIIGSVVVARKVEDKAGNADVGGGRDA